MENHKLIKSFLVTSSIGSAKKGEVLIIKKHQGLIGGKEYDLFYESEQTGLIFTKQILLAQYSNKIKPKEYFKNLKEKFEHIL
jgi:hypothetical protein